MWQRVVSGESPESSALDLTFKGINKNDKRVGGGGLAILGLGTCLLPLQSKEEVISSVTGSI